MYRKIKVNSFRHTEQMKRRRRRT